MRGRLCCYSLLSERPDYKTIGKELNFETDCVTQGLLPNSERLRMLKSADTDLQKQSTLVSGFQVAATRASAREIMRSMRCQWNAQCKHAAGSRRLRKPGREQRERLVETHVHASLT